MQTVKNINVKIMQVFYGPFCVKADILRVRTCGCVKVGHGGAYKLITIFFICGPLLDQNVVVCLCNNIYFSELIPSIFSYFYQYF